MPRAKTKSKRKPWTTARKAKFKRLCESGAPVADIASEMRVSKDYVRALRHRFGLTPRYPAAIRRLRERAALTLPPLSPDLQVILDRRERRERLPPAPSLPRHKR